MAILNDKDRGSIEKRKILSDHFDSGKTRPWLDCEIQVVVHPVKEDDTHLERWIDGSETKYVYQKWSDSIESAKTDESSYLFSLNSLTLPSMGLTFSPSASMIGAPQPQVSDGVISLDINLSSQIKNSIGAVNEKPVRIAQVLSVFGGLYDRQFTRRGTLRLMPAEQKPTVDIVLVNNDRRSVFGGKTQSMWAVLYRLKNTRFSMPTPSAGNQSSVSPLSFKVDIIYEDYEITPPEGSNPAVENAKNTQITNLRDQIKLAGFKFDPKIDMSTILKKFTEAAQCPLF